MGRPGVDAAYGYTEDPWHTRHPLATCRIGRKTGRYDNPTFATRRALAAGEARLVLLNSQAQELTIG
jgi:hypothetical protein